MALPKKKLVLWGFHPAHCPEPIKLAEYSKKAAEARRKEGWIVGGYREGDAPLGLIAQAKELNNGH